MTDYPTFTEVLVIHKELIDKYGGSHGLRDPGALESALYRPQSGYYEDLLQEAAALWESLSQNHPFIDGNKRVAFAVMYTFLAINNFYLKANPEETYLFINGLYESQTFEYSKLYQWLQENT
jgi:death-on-curing protein